MIEQHGPPADLLALQTKWQQRRDWLREPRHRATLNRMDERPANPMRNQVFSLPQLLREQFDVLEGRSRALLPTPTIFASREVILTGCGDSQIAGDLLCGRNGNAFHWNSGRAH